jgi:acetyltransferase-like isoleucine patch superfamily enzyme
MIKKTTEYFVKKKNRSFKFSSTVTNYEALMYMVKLTILVTRSVLFYRISPKKMCMIGSCVKIDNRSHLKIGSRVKLGDFVYLDALGDRGLVLRDGVSLGAFSRIVVSSSYSNLGVEVSLGNNVGIGEFSRIGGSGGVDIGDDTIVGQYFSCHPENHIFTCDEKLIRMQGTQRDRIVIGNDCWIGAKVTICAGVNIGAGSVVAAGCVVTKSFPEFAIIAGVPARQIGSRKKELK